MAHEKFQPLGRLLVLAFTAALYCSAQVRGIAAQHRSTSSAAPITATAPLTANTSSNMGPTRMTCNASPTANHAGIVEEVPAGMERESELIEALTSIPLISKAVCRPSSNPSAIGVDITVSSG